MEQNDDENMCWYAYVTAVHEFRDFFFIAH